MILDNFTPLPKDLRGWNGDAPIFKRMVEEVRPKVIVEVGSWKGQSTVSLAKACKELGLDTKIYCIDTWLGAIEFYTHPTEERDLMKKHGYPQVYYQFISNLYHEGVLHMVETIPLPSNVAHIVAPQADLIYIDASHEYQDVVDDIENFSKKLNEGGIMFGDDYNNSVFPGVRQAVDEANGVAVDGWYWAIYN